MIGKAEGNPDLTTQFDVGKFHVSMAFEAAQGILTVVWNPDLPKYGEVALNEHYYLVSCHSNFLAEITSQTGIDQALITLRKAE